MEKKRLQWHTAFQAALQIDLQDDLEHLQFLREYNLTRKPLQIDTLVVKLKPGKTVQKSLGRIFRQYNIVEYKSPDDHLSINDFFKVMAYTCLFQANTGKVREVPPEELTVTLISSHYPRVLVNFLKEQYGVTIEKAFPGIFYVTGLLFPVQIVVNGKLSREEHVWLSRLRRNLKAKEDIEPLAKAYRGKEQHPLYAAAMDLIVQANEKEYEEEIRMCNALRELFASEFVVSEEKGKLLSLISLVCKKLEKSQPVDVIAEALETDSAQINSIVEAARTCAPGYDVEEIYQVLTKVSD